MPSTEGFLTIDYNNFSRGEYGKLGGENAPFGSFHGSNMEVYANGMLGPRPGLKDITPTSMPNGVLLGLHRTPVPNKDGMFVIGNTVYIFDLFNLASAPNAIGTFDTTPTEPVSIKEDTATLLVAVPGDAIYRVDPDAGTVVKLTGSPAAHDVEIYDAQVVGADSETSPRIEASEPGDPNDWSGGRFIDIGDNWQVTALHTLKNYLAVFKRKGIHLVSGVIGDPATQFVRKIVTPNSVLHPYASAIDALDRIWYWPIFREDIGMFNGAQISYTSHIGAPDVQRDDTVAAPPLKRGMTILDGDLSPSTIVAVQAGTSQMAIVQHNNIWSYHTFETTISGMIANGSDDGRLLITDGGGVSAPAKIFTTTWGLNRPGFTSDGLTGVGDDSDTPIHASVTFPQEWAAPYRRYPVPSLRIRQIVVDFIKWDTGATATNHFDVIFKSLSRNGKDDTVKTFEDPFDEAGTEATTEGIHARKTFNTFIDFGGGFEITLDNVRGVAFKSVTVHYEIDSNRPRA